MQNRAASYLILTAAGLVAGETARAQAAQEPAGSSAIAIPTDDVIMLQLFDGRVLWGRISGHDAERLTFQRLDTGGTAQLPWSLLDPDQAGEYLERFGYVDHSGDELMVEADRIVLDDGQEIIGKIVNRTPRELYVKTSTSLFPVPMARLRGQILPLQVPALDIYTRGELYQGELPNLEQASAESHFALATYCERILDFVHAAEHYEAARALDPGFMPDELPQFLQRASAKAQNQAQLDHLFEADRLRARRKYDEALVRLEEFELMYPETSLTQELIKKRSQVEKARDQALTVQVPQQFHSWTKRLTAKVARDPKLGFTSAIEYVESSLTDDVLEAVLSDMQRTVGMSVTSDEVRRKWQERPRGRIRRASYGQGTWLLGEDRARAELQPEVEAAAPQTEKGAERARLEEKIKRYMQNQQLVQRAKAAADQESELEAFWSTWNSNNRSQWLLAYYVEQGGEMKIRTPVHFRNCRDCNGSAVREIIDTGNARSGSQSASMRLIKCPLCQGIGVMRRVDYW
jgi:tetratricopeptide (TPR) repeat protein